ncbi:hypothetical protein HDV00_000299 [Rhizophlyctis rosea]|nr:hypothetical protein HDV00_000299 [Rhizophlyctis rosea]
MKTRREFREYTPEQRDQYVQAIQCLRRTPSRMSPSIRSPSAYDDFVYVHWQAQDQAHNTAVFPPWHSVFLSIYETALNSCGWSEPLPYWDWSYDSQEPENSELWSPRWFGGNGNGRCISTGFLANQQATFPTPHCINRNWDIEASASASDGDAMIGAQFPEVAMEYLTSVSTYDDLRHALEDHPHNSVHSAVGGDLSDPRTSTNDPVFFMHHANIDRWWRKWQAENPQAAHDYSGNTVPGRNDNTATPNDIMTYYGMFPDTPVWQAFDTVGGMNGAWCFNYSLSITNAGASSGQQVAKRSIASFKSAQAQQQQSQYNQQSSQGPSYSPYGDPKNPNTPHAYDRTDKYNIRAPARLPEQMLVNMGYSEEQKARIRKEEEHIYDFIDYINAVEGFVSTCALVNKEHGYKPCSKEEYEKMHMLRQFIIAGAKAIIGGFKEIIRVGIQTFFQEIGERYYGSQNYKSPQSGSSYQYQAPSYEAPSYQAPSYQAPSYQTPTYQTPTYQTPTYQKPSYETPGYGGGSTYQKPTYNQGPSSSGGYEAPNPVRPSYH